MTAYVPGQSSEEEAGSDAPSLFGIQFTPPVIGVLVAVLGLAGAAYLFVTLLMPTWEQLQTKKSEIETKEKEKQELATIEAQVKAAEAKVTEAQQKKAGVTALFANPNSLSTLLLDINKRIEARNSTLPEDRIKARLTKFEPDPLTSGIVNDSSFGAQINGKIYRQAFNVQMEGTFDQTRLFLIELERQKSLSVVKELKSTLAESTQRIAVNQQAGQIVPIGNPETKINTAFKLQVLRPLTPEEQKLVAPAPAAATPSPSPSPK